jgi:hypothetical protein
MGCPLLGLCRIGEWFLGGREDARTPLVGKDIQQTLLVML